MAYPVWRRGRKRVYVYFNDPNDGRLKQIPRDETKHLDGRPPDEVVAWVEKWERSHGMARERSRRTQLSEGDLLTSLWSQYQSHRSATRKRRARTSAEETQLLERYIVPFFVYTKGAKDPATWHDLVPPFHTYMFGLGLADATIRKTLWVLERFGRHLVFQRHMTFPFAIQVPARGNSKVTPLKTRKDPGDILAYEGSRRYHHINFRLMALLGYFAALRPSELFALEKGDLLTGDAAEEATRTLDGFRREKLGSRLSVRVTKTLSDETSAPVPMVKTDTSLAVVNIWDTTAARAIAEIVRDMPPGRLFPFSYSWLEAAWRRYVAPDLGTTPHDLRRASALYLGRTKRLPLTLLQEHMRHAEIETTMLYVREPSIPEKTRKSRQDFDDVA